MSDQPTGSGDPLSFDELVVRMHSSVLTPSHRRLAEYVMADPESVAFMTISELASAVGVNEATVVRFATALGLPGYPGLTRLCRQRLQAQAQLLRRYDSLKRLEGGAENLLQQFAAMDESNIARTFSRLDPDAWAATVSLLATARRVHVMGLRKSHAPAYLLAYLLRMIREDVEIVSGSGGSLTDELRRVREGDCFVSMSIHRYSLETVRAATWAKDRGALTVSLTDNPGSPLVLSGSQVMYVDVAGPAVLRSVTAFTSLVQALAGGAAQLRGQDARDALLQEEGLLQAFSVYAADPPLTKA